jgi:hypothetical protein
MTLVRTFVVAGIASLLIGTPQAFAQRRGGGHSRGASAGSRAVAVPRGSSSRSVSVGRAAAPSVYATSRTIGAARTIAFGPARAYAVGRRNGVIVGRAAPRIVGPRVIGTPRVIGSTRVIRPRIISVAPVRFYQPYYAFRPRVSLGFGLWVGFPISYPYPYAYYYPYPYPYSYPAYGYPYPAANYPIYPPGSYPSAAGSMGVQPGAVNINTGGVSFEITPNTATVYVDGAYVGTADQFTSTSQPLGLTPGRHHIQIQAPGYQTLDFDVDIVAGQVIPYQGTMQR